MVSPNKWRRNFQKYYSFLTSCFWSLAGLLFYLVGKNYFSFPNRWLVGNSRGQVNFFPLGVSIHSGVNFFLQTLFSLLVSEKKVDYFKIRKWKYWTKKILIFAFSFFSFFDSRGNYIYSGSGNQSKWGDALLLGIIGIVINCCLIDLLLQLMDQYGVCNAFNLIFFTDCLPIGWIKGWEDVFYRKSLGLFLITVLFVWITNLKWEVPVETNVLYSQNSTLTKETPSYLGFKLNFSFMHFFYLSWLLTSIYSLKTAWKDIGSSKGLKEIILKFFVWIINGMGGGKTGLGINKEISDQSLGDILLIINEKKNLFNLGEWQKIFATERKWRFFGGASFLLFLRWLASWFQISQIQCKSNEISEDLQQQGVYLDGIPPGRPTQKLIKKIVNKLIIFWFFLIVIPFNLVFDNFISGDESLSFIGWFSSVNVGVSLIQQIRTKYKYVQANQ
jgi:preprotein translocase subunit SecY